MSTCTVYTVHWRRLSSFRKRSGSKPSKPQQHKTTDVTIHRATVLHSLPTRCGIDVNVLPSADGEMRLHSPLGSQVSPSVASADLQCERARAYAGTHYSVLVQCSSVTHFARLRRNIRKTRSLHRNWSRTYSSNIRKRITRTLSCSSPSHSHVHALHLHFLFVYPRGKRKKKACKFSKQPPCERRSERPLIRKLALWGGVSLSHISVSLSPIFVCYVPPPSSTSIPSPPAVSFPIQSRARMRRT